MNAKKLLLLAGLTTALAVPAGAAVAASTPSPSPAAPSSVQSGAGHARMMGGSGYGDSEDCPFFDSATATKWRDSRAARQQLSPVERQKLVQQHRDAIQGMWAARSS